MIKDNQDIYWSVEVIKDDLKKLSDKINKYIPDEEPHAFIRLKYYDNRSDDLCLDRVLREEYSVLYERKHDKVIKTVYKNNAKWDRFELNNYEALKDMMKYTVEHKATIDGWGISKEYIV